MPGGKSGGINYEQSTVLDNIADSPPCTLRHEEVPQHCITYGIDTDGHWFQTEPELDYASYVHDDEPADTAFLISSGNVETP